LVSRTKPVLVWIKNRGPELSLRKQEKLGTVHAHMINSTVAGRYFKEFEGVVTNLILRNCPKQISNADETGKNLEHSRAHVVTRRGAKNYRWTNKQRSFQSCMITIMVC